MTSPLTIAFDLDGTLIDTAPDLARAMNAVLADHGRAAVPLEDVRHMVGQGARALMKKGMAATGRPASESELDGLFDEFLAFYLANLSAESRVFDGVVDVLDRCRDAGHLLGVCTNKPEGASRMLLDDLGLAPYFQSVVGGDTLAVRKPDAAHITETVARAGGIVARSVMVGDSANDIDAARNTGVPVIAVSFGYTQTPVRQLGPDRVIDHFDGFWEALEALRDKHAM